MRHRRFILPLIVPALAAGIIAIVRDGLVRRMVLPARPPAEARLRQVYPRIQIAGKTSFGQVIDELRKQTGANIVPGEKLVDGELDDRAKRVELDLWNVTLAQVLDRI